MTKYKLVRPLLALAAFAAIGGGAGLAAVASAQTASPTTGSSTAMQSARHAETGHDGTITSISGSTITMQEEADEGGATYTVNAGSATVVKGGAASTLSSLTVGDKIFVDGTVSGTSVTATKVTSGMRGMGGHHGFGDHGPGIMGKVTAVSGTTLTVTDLRNSTSYTVDASNAKVLKFVSGQTPTTISVSGIAVGDTVGVRGTISGTTVTATDVMDGMPSRAHGPPAGVQ